MIIAMAIVLAAAAAGNVSPAEATEAAVPSPPALANRSAGFEMPRLSWSPAGKDDRTRLRPLANDPGIEVAGKPASVRRNDSANAPVCTMRVMPADPHVDPRMAVEMKHDVDSGMAVRSGCKE